MLHSPHTDNQRHSTRRCNKYCMPVERPGVEAAVQRSQISTEATEAAGHLPPTYDRQHPAHQSGHLSAPPLQKRRPARNISNFQRQRNRLLRLRRPDNCQPFLRMQHDQTSRSSPWIGNFVGGGCLPTKERYLSALAPLQTWGALLSRFAGGRAGPWA
jgi:hypothetical protein